MTLGVERAAFFSRQERFGSVGSTNDVVAGWLAAGTPEVCLAVADEQTAGRGRAGRSWEAPRGSALLLSLGFRPSWIAPDRTWRVPAVVSLAMADAAEEAAGLADHAIRLKWPNDLVVEDAGTATGLRKLGGVLAESVDLAGGDPRLVVGIGINADWATADFPAPLAASMTSLREASGGRPVDLARLLDAFQLRIEPRIEALRDGWFDVADWTERQVTTGREVRIDLPDGTSLVERPLGVDALSGGLVVGRDAAGSERTLLVGEVTRVRLGEGA
ncbi:MAG TPA: biotin--[acetyl-CoA-carboxylase] ligase [Candidatus Limnocylindrales bacterium]|nr:biotin--[acetyl-CoA-carboxylase] ligase [Candidatus Limnocylindrales bacterium]